MPYWVVPLIKQSIDVLHAVLNWEMNGDNDDNDNDNDNNSNKHRDYFNILDCSLPSDKIFNNLIEIKLYL